MARRVAVGWALGAALLAVAVSANAQTGSTGASTGKSAAGVGATSSFVNAAEEARPATTTFFGDTGSWFVPTGEVLPNGKWSVSAYRRGTDWIQGYSNVGDFAGTFAYGIKDRAEVFGSFIVHTRVDRDLRPLFVPDATFGGVIDRYPQVNRTWSGDNIGDFYVGVKFAVDGIVSKELAQQVEVSGYAGRGFRGSPDGFNAPGGAFRCGGRLGVPSRGPVRFTSELNREVPTRSEDPNGIGFPSPSFIAYGPPLERIAQWIFVWLFGALRCLFAQLLGRLKGFAIRLSPTRPTDTRVHDQLFDALRQRRPEAGTPIARAVEEFCARSLPLAEAYLSDLPQEETMRARLLCRALVAFARHSDLERDSRFKALASHIRPHYWPRRLKQEPRDNERDFDALLLYFAARLSPSADWSGQDCAIRSALLVAAVYEALRLNASALSSCGETELSRRPEDARSLLKSRLLETQIRQHGLEIKRADLADLQGCLISTTSGSSIYVDYRLSPERTVWVVLHELGHLLLHHRPNSEYGLDPAILRHEDRDRFAEQELEADRFADLRQYVLEGFVDHVWVEHVRRATHQDVSKEAFDASRPGRVNWPCVPHTSMGPGDDVAISRTLPNGLLGRWPANAETR
jgi:hypothetical protein